MGGIMKNSIVTARVALMIACALSVVFAFAQETITEVSKSIDKANAELRKLQNSNPSVLTRKQFVEMYPSICQQTYKKFASGEDNPSLNIEKISFNDSGNFKAGGLTIINSICYCPFCKGDRGVKRATLDGERCNHPGQTWHVMDGKETAAYNKWNDLMQKTSATIQALEDIKAKKAEIEKLKAKKEELKKSSSKNKKSS